MICDTCERAPVEELTITGKISIKNRKTKARTYERLLAALVNYGEISERGKKKLMVASVDHDEEKKHVEEKEPYTSRRHNHIKVKKLTEEDCAHYTRLQKHELRTLAQKYALKERDLCMFLTRTAHDLTYDLVGCMFGLSKSRTVTINNQVLGILAEEMVPNYLGHGYWTRERIQQNTPEFVKVALDLGDDAVAVTCDGFPLYTQRIGDFSLQKLTFSGKSKRNCVTFHMLASFSGHFITVRIAEPAKPTRG